jgi:hypothetical protein
VTRARSLRAGALVVAVACALTFLGACGSSGDDPAEVAKDDRAVVQRNKEVAEFEAKIKAALREKWQKRAQAIRAQARARARARAAARAGQRRLLVRTPGGGVRSDIGDLCSPIRNRLGGKAGRAERRARLQQRRRALDYLNLRCPRF